MLALLAQVGEEVHGEEGTIVPWSPYAYAAIAFGLFLVALYAVTRLNLDR